MSDLRNPGDAWVTAADGKRYWGRFGAAGLLAHDPARGVLLQHRVSWSDHGGTWGIPGGARHEGEDAVSGALRESTEEAGVPAPAILPRFSYLIDRGGWTYTTIIASVTAPFEARITDPESHALEWVPLERVAGYELHPGFGASWPLLRPLLADDADTARTAAAALAAAGSLSPLP
ncbi:NUDIX hydrolase [Leucobacter weissii]|uniref:NUDIX hydrolase n=1 Tax=Leucobacter weissii TaxID=1983706 RepID=A0A939MLP4_9MICO|nr:NUDIX hydrolase [Leucobacter weissii]